MSFIQNKKPPFIQSKQQDSIEITVIKEKNFSKWEKAQPKYITTQITQSGCGTGGKDKKILLLQNTKGELSNVILIIKTKIARDDFAKIASTLNARLSETQIGKLRFALNETGLSQADIFNACIGWAAGSYSFNTYKEKKPSKNPILIWPDRADKKRVETFLHAMCIVRDLINTPANHLGPVEIEKEIKALAKSHKATVTTIADKKLIEKNFPLIYTVGQAGAKDRRPRLVELKWGNKKHPRLSLVGKGVVFDTGGLNIKPTPYMALMKKDMGGAAHAIALAHIVMALKLPVYLQLLIPTVENAIAGEAFRPGDIIKARSGLHVENTNTDAEGRLILADALTYAAENKPDLLIDFATLTGSARAALGQDIPAMFSTQDKTAQDLQARSFEIDDPLWRMPLYDAYNKHIENATGDLVNSAGLPGDLIYSALFLKKFIGKAKDWIHLDLFAWESAGRPGRTKGGTEMSLHALFDYLENRYKT